MIKPSPKNLDLSQYLCSGHNHLRDGRAMTVYPNLTLWNREIEKYIVISHGHFIENIYYLMSNLQSIFT